MEARLTLPSASFCTENSFLVLDSGMNKLSKLMSAFKSKLTLCGITKVSVTTQLQQTKNKQKPPGITLGVVINNPYS